MTENEMYTLAYFKPDKLVEYVRNETSHAQLALAAEALGCIGDRSLVNDLILDLLRHESSLVREATIVGLMNPQLDGEDLPASIEQELQKMRLEDFSQGVRDVVEDLLYLIEPVALVENILMEDIKNDDSAR